MESGRIIQDEHASSGTKEPVRLLMATNPPEKLVQPYDTQWGYKLVQHYRSDPASAARDILTLDLAHFQRLMLKYAWERSYTIWVLTRGGGKTFNEAVYAILRAMLYPGEKVGVISSSFRQCFFKDLDCLPIFTSAGMTSTPMEFYDSVVVGRTRVASVKHDNTVLSKWITSGNGHIIELEGGFTIGGLGRHEILTMSEKGALVYKSLDDSMIGDWVAVKCGVGLFGNDDDIRFSRERLPKERSYLIPDKMSDDLAYWLGLVAGDGCVSHKNKKGKRMGVSFTKADPDLLESFERISMSVFGRKCGRSKKPESKAHVSVAQSRCIGDFLTHAGVHDTLATGKEIPALIRRSSKQYIAAFLSGLFDTDGSFSAYSRGGVVDISTSSRRLAMQAQCALLQFGIMSTLAISSKAVNKCIGKRNKPSNISMAYKVRITSRAMIEIFRKDIGFRSVRKKEALDRYMAGSLKTKCSPHHLIPNIHRDMIDLLVHMHTKTFWGMKNERELINTTINKCKKSTPISYDKIQEVLLLAERLLPGDSKIKHIQEFLSLGLHFRKIVSKTPHSGEAIDVEVDQEHCYVAGGLVNHNSKFVFAEMERIFDISEQFRDACAKKPVRGTDCCYIQLKSVANRPGSIVEILPLGDGAKIRGARYHTLLLDETAQIPRSILDIVVRGMMATSKNPMEGVRMMERQKALVAEGRLDKVETPAGNKMLIASTAYYQYNHLWERVRDMQDLILSQYEEWEKKGRRGACPVELRGESPNGGQLRNRIMADKKRAIVAFNYKDPPEGFMNMESIEESKREMSEQQFLMEYSATFPSDSGGFFPRSLLDKAREHKSFSSHMSPKRDTIYILGIDPARNSANFSIALFAIDTSMKRILFARMMSYNKRPFQDMALEVKTLIKAYNVVEVGMDAGGGGTTIRDLLADRTHIEQGESPILQRNFEEHEFLEGRRILELVEFSRYEWLHDANHNMLLGLQNGSILIAAQSDLVSNGASSTDEEMADEEIDQTLLEIQSIVVRFTSTGRMHWDTPSKRQRKDRYSAFLIGHYMAKSYLDNLERPVDLATGGWGR
jgi:intein/homing endonuclease